jgi:hypothetical protein
MSHKEELSDEDLLKLEKESKEEAVEEGAEEVELACMFTAKSCLKCCESVKL